MFLNHLKIGVHHLTPKHLLTRLGGQLAEIKIPIIKNTFIRWFVKQYNVDMNEALEHDIDLYSDFNAFFTRHLKPESRPLAKELLISPVDGVISQIGPIYQGQLIQAKGHTYSVESLLAQDTLSAYFQKGLFATFYLSPKDYHRIHMPIRGVLRSTTFVPGKLYSVQPLTTQHIPQLFALNERLITFFDTEIGLIAMVLVGATIVGSINTVWQGNIPRTSYIVHQDFSNQSIVLQQGQEMGYFKLGSTVILLLSEEKQIKWFEYLKPNISIQLGQQLGAYSN